MGTQPQAETLHDDYSIVWGRGPVVVHRAGGGGSNLPPPLPEHTLTVYVSGVTRRNSGGDCLPSLSLS